MKKSTIIRQHAARHAIAALTLALSATLTATADSRVPEGYDGYVVFVADGSFAAGTPHPVIPGCDTTPSICDGEYFWYEVFGTTPDEMLAAEQEAKTFVLERFGLEVDALAAVGDAVWINLYSDPRNNYRVRSLPGEQIHQYGWTVHDQAFMLTTTVEITLGGDYAGVVLPAGSSIAHGLYVIERSRLDWVDGAPVLTASGGHLVLEYQSSSPIVAPIDPRLPMTGNCEITSSPWGSGMAMFSGLWTSVDGVQLKAAIRNVVMLDGDLGLGDYPGVENDPNMTLVD